MIGLFLLREGLDTSEAVTTNGGSDQGSDSSDSGDGHRQHRRGHGRTTTTTVAGAAARRGAHHRAQRLRGRRVPPASTATCSRRAGYQLTNPDGANADAEGDAATTVIYFAPGFEAEAAAVATAIGAPDTIVPDAAPHHAARPDRGRQRGGGDRHRPRQRHADHRRGRRHHHHDCRRVARLASVDALRRPPAGARRRPALFVDFDGTLSPIVPAAADARPLPGVRRGAGRRSPRARRSVAVVSGRPVSLPRRAPPGRDRAARALRPRGARSTARSRERGRRRTLAPGRRRGGRRRPWTRSDRPASTWSTRACRSRSTSAARPRPRTTPSAWAARGGGAVGAAACAPPRCRSSSTRRSPSTRARWSRSAPRACRRSPTSATTWATCPPSTRSTGWPRRGRHVVKVAVRTPDVVRRAARAGRPSRRRARGRARAPRCLLRL